ncbi:MAG: hypothetical protein ACRDFY_10710 [Candidatus Limnocylindria bacterium]
MRYVAIGAVIVVGAIILLALGTRPVRGDGGLTDAVARAYFPRTVDAGLHAIAHQRAAEIGACACLDHAAMQPGTAEVLAWNTGLASPVPSAVGQWIGSPMHNAILSDRSYGRIGCAEGVTGGAHWFACVLAAGPLPAQPPAAPQPAGQVMALPDTAVPGPP